MVKSCDLHVDIWNTFYNIKRLLRIFQLGKCYFSNFSNIHNLKSEAILCWFESRSQGKSNKKNFQENMENML